MASCVEFYMSVAVIDFRLVKFRAEDSWSLEDLLSPAIGLGSDERFSFGTQGIIECKLI